MKIIVNLQNLPVELHFAAETPDSAIAYPFLLTVQDIVSSTTKESGNASFTVALGLYDLLGDLTGKKVILIDKTEIVFSGVITDSVYTTVITYQVEE